MLPGAEMGADGVWAWWPDVCLMASQSAWLDEEASFCSSSSAKFCLHYKLSL